MHVGDARFKKVGSGQLVRLVMVKARPDLSEVM